MIPQMVQRGYAIAIGERARLPVQITHIKLGTIGVWGKAAEVVAMLLSLVAPYTAEEMWERLGHEPTVAKAGWPVVEASEPSA